MKQVGLVGIFFLTWRRDHDLTSAGTEERVATKVGDLHHHAVVHHTVGGLEATVHLDVTGVEVRHALQAGFVQHEGRRETPSETSTEIWQQDTNLWTRLSFNSISVQ